MPDEAANIQLDQLPDDLREVFEVVGPELGLRLVERFGGLSVYFPKRDRLLIPERNAAIRREFNGSNIRDLVRRYNLSDSYVRRILADDPNAPKQTGLFEEE